MSGKTTVHSIFDFCETWKNAGYGIALVTNNKKVITPYIDPSDYPNMFVNSLNNNAKVINVEATLTFHSGCLEE